MTERRAPAIAGRLLERLSPAPHGPLVRAELDEEYERFVRPARGAIAARLWYWRQALGSIAGQRRRPVVPHSPNRGSLMDSLLKDLRFGLRSFAREPAFTALAVGTIAVGICASTLVFAVLHAVLLRSMPYPGPERMVRLWNEWVVSKDVTEQLIEGTRSFEAIAGITPERQALAGRGEPVELYGAAVTAGYFALTGARMELGRVFTLEESEPGAPRPVILSHGTWDNLFGGDPGLVGQQIELGGVQRTIVGVADASHRPLAVDAAYWVPITFDREDFSDYTGVAQVSLHARLAEGVSLEAAADDVGRIARRVQEAAPGSFGAEWVAASAPRPLQQVRVADSALGLWTVMGAVGCLLLIACTNVANLMLARSSRRQREMAIRVCLGAGPVRLTRQLLTESLMVGAAGGVAGLGLSPLLLDPLRTLLPSSVARPGDVVLDAAVALFALGSSVVTSVLFGLAPALRAAHADPQSQLRDATPATSRGRRGARAGRLFVAAEVALAVMLVAGAGLMLRTLGALAAVDPGFATERVLTMRVRLPASADYADNEQRLAYFVAVQERLEAIGAVDSAGAVAFLPMGGQAPSAIYRAEGVEYPEGVPPPNANFQFVSGDYFRTMRIPLLSGRAFDERDTPEAPVVGVINTTLAREAFGDESPIGKTITMFGGTDLRVIGVVADARQRGPMDEPDPEVFFAYPQIPWWQSMYLTVRSGPEQGLDPATVRAAIWQVDPDIPVADVREMADVVSSAAADSRFLARLLGAFAALALLLGAVGVYGVMTYDVGERMYEFGIRVALGASRADILRRAVLGSLAPAGLGVAIGTGLALALSRLLREMLFGIAPHDPITFVAVPTLLLAVGVLATWVPAYRAATADPRASLG